VGTRFHRSLSDDIFLGIDNGFIAVSSSAFHFQPCSSPISPAQPILYQNDSHRPPPPRPRIHPWHRRCAPHLPPADQRNRREGTKRSRTLEARMHERYPE